MQKETNTSKQNRLSGRVSASIIVFLSQATVTVKHVVHHLTGTNLLAWTSRMVAKGDNRMANSVLVILDMSCACAISKKKKSNKVSSMTYTTTKFCVTFINTQVFRTSLIPKTIGNRKEIVREVARGDKPYLRKATDRKAQIRKAFVSG